MTQFMYNNSHWTLDPFDIVWKNFFDVNSTFTTFENKINYPVDILETEDGLRFELAVVGLSESDLDIQVDGDTLRITYEKPETEEIKNYLQKGIAKRSFDLAWKVASKFELSKLDASLDKGLLTINIPYAPEKAPKKIEIKVNNKKILKG
jgi:HSP20 family molecular chaperone IbpA